jgi:leucine dehydrogenase
VSVWSASGYDRHELVVYHRDPASQLSAIVAVHARRDGRGCGGCRMKAYASEADALNDVLRLSRAMSYKAALADVEVGGAKAVIMGDPRHDKTEDLLLAMGRLVESFGGAYISAPDVGIGVSDLRVIRSQTKWVCGADEVAGPSAPYTALGVLEGMRAAVEDRLKRDSFGGLRVAIQGVGSVGTELARSLVAAGASVLVADVDDEAVRVIVDECGAEPASVEEILFADVDIVSPNALGGVLNDATIPRIRAGIVCGAANNQLAEDRHAALLHERRIVFCPDYVVSAGGLIAGIEEFHGFDPHGAFDADATRARIHRIGETMTEILRVSSAEGIPEHHAAARIARDRIASWGTTSRVA